jgi:hypothetical protein
MQEEVGEYGKPRGVTNRRKIRELILSIRDVISLLAPFRRYRII